MTCKLFLLQEQAAQHCVGAVSPVWQVCGGRLHPFKHATYNSQHQGCSVGKSPPGIRMANFRGREAERWSVFSAQACLPCTQGHARQGWQPLCRSDHLASSTGCHQAAASLPSTASPLMCKREGKEIKHEALQQGVAKGVSPSLCPLVLPACFGLAVGWQPYALCCSTGTRDSARQRDLGAQEGSNAPVTATANLSTAQQLSEAMPQMAGIRQALCPFGSDARGCSIDTEGFSQWLGVLAQLQSCFLAGFSYAIVPACTPKQHTPNLPPRTLLFLGSVGSVVSALRSCTRALQYQQGIY